MRVESSQKPELANRCRLLWLDDDVFGRLGCVLGIVFAVGVTLGAGLGELPHAAKMPLLIAKAEC